MEPKAVKKHAGWRFKNRWNAWLCLVGLEFYWPSASKLCMGIASPVGLGMKGWSANGISARVAFGIVPPAGGKQIFKAQLELSSRDDRAKQRFRYRRWF